MVDGVIDQFRKDVVEDAPDVVSEILQLSRARRKFAQDPVFRQARKGVLLLIGQPFRSHIVGCRALSLWTESPGPYQRRQVAVGSLARDPHAFGQ